LSPDASAEPEAKKDIQEDEEIVHLLKDADPDHKSEEKVDQ
jgi:hypothetical protein